MVHRLARPLLPAFAVLLTALTSPALAASALAADARRDVTFLSTSDCHYAAVVKEDRNARDLDTVRAMNAVADLSWPDELGGGRVASPRGVVVLGDVIDDGDLKVEGVNRSERQYAAFLGDFGLDGKDGLLKYPVFEGWGNHDGPPEGKEKNGFSFQAHLKERNAARLRKGLITNLSSNGLHYSWDWDDVHFVQLNIYPADQQRAGIRYSADWHNPQGSLSFLKQDLAEKVGDSGRPVVLMSHCGFDTDWWSPEDWADLYAAVKPYRVILYLYGHSGTGVRAWAPEATPGATPGATPEASKPTPKGAARKLLCLNDGQTENGFFVIQVRGNRVRFGYRVKTWKERPPSASPSALGPGSAPSPAAGQPQRIWTGEWSWRWTGTAEISRTGTAAARWDG